MSSISIAGLSWRTPDHQILFNNLNLIFGPFRTGLIGRNGTGKTTLLRLINGEMSPTSGAIVKPRSVGFLRQNPDQRKDGILADLFGATEQLILLRRAERGEATSDDLARADWTLTARLESALAAVHLEVELNASLASLSGGQRTRADLAALIFAGHDALLLDEPTNHLDRAGRRHVIEALQGWHGCAIVASHDRTLLDQLDAIVELTSIGANVYGGNYRAYRAVKDAELASKEKKLARAERAFSDVREEARLAKERKARTDRQGKQLRISGSQSKLILDAAKERSQGSDSLAARLRNDRAEKAQAALETARAAVEVLQPLTMEIPPTGLASTRDVLKVEGLHFAYPGEIPLIRNVSFSIRGPERIAIDGANGTGKSTLLACIQGRLTPQFGSISLNVSAAFIDQNLDFLDPHETIREAFARLDPGSTENERRATLARFSFRGNDQNQCIASLSGGQRMRAGLACTMGRSCPPQLLLLDEPSNHLDIEAVEALEAALRAYDGALIVISHDQAFLKRTGVERWLVL